MSEFVWAKFAMLMQLDVLAPVSWVIIALMATAVGVMYLAQWTAPVASAGLSSMRWVPADGPSSFLRGKGGPARPSAAAPPSASAWSPSKSRST